MKLNCVIYTTVRNEADLHLMQKDIQKAREFLLRTPGREDVTFTVIPIPSPEHVPTIKDKDGHNVLSWDWFKKTFRYISPTGYTAIGFHFLPSERTKWGIKRTLGGTYFRDPDDVLDFWLCATPGVQARNYSFSEFLRIVLHEIQHGDVHWTGARRELVHEWDYDKHAIQELPLHLSYEKWNLWKALRDATASLLTLIQLKKKL